MKVLFAFFSMQCTAFLLVYALLQWVPLPSPGPQALIGSLAAIGVLLKRRRPWPAVLHFCFPFFCWEALSLRVAPHYWLLLSILSWLIWAGAFKHHVPLYLSNRSVLDHLSHCLPKGAKVMDFGAGTGTVLAWLARHRPDLALYGVEIALLPWLIAKIRLRHTSVNLRRGDGFSYSLAPYDVVYVYLSSVPMEALWEKVSRELRPDAWLISNTFLVPDRVPTQTWSLHDWKKTPLFLWQRDSQTPR